MKRVSVPLSEYGCCFTHGTICNYVQVFVTSLSSTVGGHRYVSGSA